MLLETNIVATDSEPIDLPIFPSPVEGLIEPGVTLLGGIEGEGTSSFLANLSIGVASGGEAFGRFDSNRGFVLHLGLRENRRRFQQRLERIEPDGDLITSLYLDEWPTVSQGGLAMLNQWVAERSGGLVVIDMWSDLCDVQEYHEDFQPLHNDIRILSNTAKARGVGIVIAHKLAKRRKHDPFNGFVGGHGLQAAADAVMVLQRYGASDWAGLHVRRGVSEETWDFKFNSGRSQWTCNGPDQGCS